ncbi:MAG: hypothetical protein ABI880_15925, partial [Acidobacteriota bacterium]
LFVPARHADMKKSDWSPVPAPDTLVDTEGLVSGKTHAWSLSGLDLEIGKGNGITMFENQSVDSSGRLADPKSLSDAAAWLDWRRIPDLSRIAKGAKLRASYKKIGLNVLGRIHLRGGELRGATPKDPGGVATPWTFSDGFSQVITDRFEFHCEVAGSALKAHGYAGSRRQSIGLSGAASKSIRLTVVHEATPSATALHTAAQRKKAAKGAGQQLPHYTAFYGAIEGAAVGALGAPRAGASIDNSAQRPIIDTPTCPPALL